MEGSAAFEERFAGYFANWGIRLPESAVELEEPGLIQQDGWTIRYVFGNDAGGSYLEFYATHRMTNDTRVRIYSSGETKDLEALETMFGFDPKIPGDEERAARENRRRNTRIAKELEARGSIRMATSMPTSPLTMSPRRSLLGTHSAEGSPDPRTGGAAIASIAVSPITGDQLADARISSALRMWNAAPTELGRSSDVALVEGL